MSQFLFYSSPPTFSQQNSSAPSLFTPQVHRANHTSWRTAAFVPPAPSPLRTSRNVNIMNSRSRSDNFDLDNENSISASDMSSNIGSSPSKPTTNGEQQQGAVSNFFFSARPTSTDANEDSQKSRASQFQKRARQSTAGAQLQSHVKGSRKGRKRLFLDRIRNRRADARDERGETQLRRLEYLQDLQELQLEMDAADAGLDMIDPDAEEADLMYSQTGQEQLSPTEDLELEALLSYLQPENERASDNDFMFDEDDDFDDDFLAALEPSPPCASGTVISGGQKKNNRPPSRRNEDMDDGDTEMS